MSNYKKIRLLVIDVDGTLTDGSIYYDSLGNEMKKFNTKDAAGVFAAKAMGIKTMILTGRESVAVNKRMKDLKVDYVFQGISDKKTFLIEYMKEKNMTGSELGYIGDDLNDYESMKLASYIACPKDACDEIRIIADYVSSVNGGSGAVRDCITHLLKKRGEWEKAIAKAYNFGV